MSLAQATRKAEMKLGQKKREWYQPLLAPNGWIFQHKWLKTFTTCVLAADQKDLRCGDCSRWKFNHIHGQYVFCIVMKLQPYRSDQHVVHIIHININFNTRLAEAHVKISLKFQSESHDLCFAQFCTSTEKVRDPDLKWDLTFWTRVGDETVRVLLSCLSLVYGR